VARSPAGGGVGGAEPSALQCCDHRPVRPESFTHPEMSSHLKRNALGSDHVLCLLVTVSKSERNHRCMRSSVYTVVRDILIHIYIYIYIYMDVRITYGEAPSSPPFPGRTTRPRTTRPFLIMTDSSAAGSPADNSPADNSPKNQYLQPNAVYSGFCSTICSTVCTTVQSARTRSTRLRTDSSADNSPAHQDLQYNAVYGGVHSTIYSAVYSMVQ